MFVWGYPLQKKQSWKSLERGLGKNLSPERFAPVVGINFCTSTGFNAPASFFVSIIIEEVVAFAAVVVGDESSQVNVFGTAEDVHLDCGIGLL